MNTKTIVISGINVTNSGILSVMTDCLEELVSYSKESNLKIIALVHSKSLYTIENVDYIEFPKSKTSWLYRIYYEYFYFHTLSKKINADIWFSMQDLSPRVHAKKKFVYCHNPSPFYKTTIKDWMYGFRICLFAWFFRYAYQFNIKSNTAVFVQQFWIKKRFEKWFAISNVKVAQPTTKVASSAVNITLDSTKINLFYPSFPRMFKNLEYICKAVLLLPTDLQNSIKVFFTIDGTENKYAKMILEKYGSNSCFEFVGALDRKTVSGYYQAMDALVFSSKLETWGLPLTESKEFNKPIFVSDLPFAHETIGKYSKVVFFDLENPEDLTHTIAAFSKNRLHYHSTTSDNTIAPDFVGWNSIFDAFFKE